MPFRATIGGVDQSAYFVGFDFSPGGDGVVGSARLLFDKQNAGLDILDLMDVQVWQTFNDAGAGIAVRGRLFGGLVSRRDTTPIGTTQIWALDCWDYNYLLTSIVRDAEEEKAVTLAEGAFEEQLAELVQIIQENGLGTVDIAIDATSGIAFLWDTMPASTYPGGHNLGWYVAQLCILAQGLSATGGVVTDVTVTDGGHGYQDLAEEGPTVVVGPPPPGGVQAEMSCVMDRVVYTITVTNGGASYETAPTVAITGGGGTGATGTAVINEAGEVAFVTITNPGTGFTSNPTVGFSGGGGAGAAATATVTGIVADITIDEAGSGYTAPPSVTIVAGEGGNGEGALAEATVSALVYGVRPAYYMGLGTSSGASEVFGPPTLYVYDRADEPSPVVTFSDTAPAGGRKRVYGTFRRVTDASGPVVQRRQAVWGDQGTVLTSQVSASQTTYPNPYINHGDGSGFWMQEVLTDGSSLSQATAQSALDQQLAVQAYPRDTYEWETEERVLPGEYIGLGWSLEGIAEDTLFRVASVTAIIEPPNTITSRLTVNTRRMGLLDDGTTGIFAPPVEGEHVNPLPPISVALTSNTWEPTPNTAALLWAIGASPSLDVVGYNFIGWVNNTFYNVDTGPSLTPTIHLPPGVPFALRVRAYDSFPLYSFARPIAAIEGTTASASIPATPVITGITSALAKDGYYATVAFTFAGEIEGGDLTYERTVGGQTYIQPFPAMDSPGNVVVRGLAGGVSYDFFLTVRDLNHQQSLPSNTMSHTPGPQPMKDPPTPSWDEIHPDTDIPGYTQVSPLAGTSVSISSVVTIGGRASLVMHAD